MAKCLGCQTKWQKVRSKILFTHNCKHVSPYVHILERKAKKLVLDM